MTPDLKTTLVTFAVQNVLPLLLTAATGIFAWAGIWAKNLIKAKVKNVQLAGILDRLADHVNAAVLEAEQAVRPTLQSVINSGTLSKFDSITLRNDVISTVKEHLGKNGVSELASILGISDIDSFIRTQVEAAVARLNDSSNGTAVAVAVAPPAAPAPLTSALGDSRSRGYVTLRGLAVVLGLAVLVGGCAFFNREFGATFAADEYDCVKNVPKDLEAGALTKLKPILSDLSLSSSALSQALDALENAAFSLLGATAKAAYQCAEETLAADYEKAHQSPDAGAAAPVPNALTSDLGGIDNVVYLRAKARLAALPIKPVHR